MKKAGVMMALLALFMLVSAPWASASLALPGTSAALSCKKVQLCHNSNGVAYTTMDLFSSLEPIFSTLGLGAVNEYVDVVALPPMAIHGCSCSTPVEVGFSLPASNGHTAASVGRMVEAFIEEHLAARMRNLACHSEVEEAQCQPDQLAAARRLLSDMAIELAPEAAAVPMAVSAVPEAAAMEQPGDYGGYGGYGGYGYGSQGSADTETPGSYGGYGYGGYGGYGSDSTPAAEPTPAAAVPTPRNLMGRVPLPSTTVAPKALIGTPAAPSSSSKECYCRYNEATNAWALLEPACKAGLYRRCDVGDNLLECAHLTSYYTEGDAAAGEKIAAFLFVDCPPAAPCSCASLKLDGSDDASVSAQCCSDLRAHCQVPFSGLSCEEVSRFCAAGADAASSDAVSAFIMVKTHGATCAAPNAPTKAYKASTSGSVSSADAAAALLQGAMHTAGRPWPVLVLVVVSGLVAVAAALLGMAALWQHLTYRQYTAPLLGDY